MNTKKTVGEDADQVCCHGLDIPAGAQARGPQLCIVQAVYQSGDLAPLVRDSGEDVLMVNPHKEHSMSEQIFGSVRALPSPAVGMIAPTLRVTPQLESVPSRCLPLQKRPIPA